ncbi:hypothetical protein ASC64_09735 [Nocardioides sp. Root122]|uniref:hypothetical protein n=1 Tax=Nocardioides TaxID=1839 RepID=UPI00070277D4|nr:MULTISPECIES: hypothetical protein [Nocardioides]KQV67524.1 hypothetical protein ASC64_09735 [Nocardioides sp. Root122]MCK9824974.1 hypothetical protein [Nocardioides cavernae]
MKILKRLGGAVAVAALALSTVSLATPAQAAPGDATLTFAPTAVLPDNTCIDHAYTYSVELPQGTTSWSIVIELVAPDGTNAHRESFGTFNGDPSAASGGLQLCSVYEQYGTYTVATTVDYKVGTSPTVFGARQVEGTIEVVGQAKSKVSLKAKRKGSKVKAAAKVSVTVGSTTGAPAQGSKITFQKKVGKKWKKVAKGTTNASGVAKAKFKAKKGDRVRAVFAGAGEVIVGSGSTPVPGAKSKAVRIR